MSGSKSAPSTSRFERSGGACLSPSYTSDGYLRLINLKPNLFVLAGTFYGRNLALKTFWAYFQSNPSFDLSLCSFSSCWRGFGTKALGEKFRLVSFRQKLRCRVLFCVTTSGCVRKQKKKSQKIHRRNDPLTLKK